MDVPENAGWLLDEYDAESYWTHVHERADLDHLSDPLVRLSEADGPCWEWRGANAKGYGRWEWRGSWHQAHRISYQRRAGATIRLCKACRAAYARAYYERTSAAH